MKRTPFFPLEAGKTAGALALLALAGFLAYGNTFGVPFIMDDIPAIVEAPFLHNLHNLAAILNPFQGSTVGGRPVLNLTLALNHAVSGLSVWSYHAFNLIAHVLSAFLVFGLVRRALGDKRLRDAFAGHATGLAFFCALLWLVHPLNTEAVTYIHQRSTSLGGFFCLLTFYCALRGWRSQARTFWHVAASAAFILGAGVKESVAVVPLLVFLYDLMFVHERPDQALKQSGVLYGGLALGWLFLGMVLAGGATAQLMPEPKCTPFEYLRTQAQVIVHYLRLAAWPDALCFDYEWPKASIGKAAPYAVGMALLVLATAAACWRRRPAGFCGAWFFLCLAPTSSFLPLSILAMEHRMYLSLAAVIVLAVLGGYRACLHLTGPARKRALAASMILALALAVVLGVLTHARNAIYSDPISLWTDTLKKSPKNYRACLNLGVALYDQKDFGQALSWFERALALKPDHLPALLNTSALLTRLDRPAQALEHLKKAARLYPDRPEINMNLGEVLSLLGKNEEAAAYYDRVLRSLPCSPEAFTQMGTAAFRIGRADLATAYLQESLRLNPNQGPARELLADILAARGRTGEAAGQYREALRTGPETATLHFKLGNLCLAENDLYGASEQYRLSLSVDPGFGPALNNLGYIRLVQGDWKTAEEHFMRLLSLEPQSPLAHYSLACLKASENQPDMALAYLQKAVALGFRSCDWLEKDRELQNIRDLAAFKAIVAECRSKGR